jgi:hypothetical protein
MQASQQNQLEQSVTPFLPNIRKSCQKCAHIRVCAVYRAIDPLLNQSFTDATKPFDTNDLANICKAFVATSLLPSVSEGESA